MKKCFQYFFSLAWSYLFPPAIPQLTTINKIPNNTQQIHIQKYLIVMKVPNMKKWIIMSSIHTLKKSISLLAIMQRKFLKKIMPLLMIYNPHLTKAIQNVKNATQNKSPYLTQR